MKKLLFPLIAFSLVLGAANGKQLTFEQVFLRKGDVLLQPLPDISGWSDDSAYTESREDKIYLVSARSGRVSQNG